jgi:hypothetical protein
MEIWHEKPEDTNLALNIVDNVEFQNSNTNLMIRDRMLAGSDANDQVKLTENYGLSLENPIFVNGPFGQQSYLSRLRTRDGVGFLFQRLGSTGITDIYELISFDGKHHLQVFLNMYHPNRSRFAVHGFWLNENPNAFTGFTFASENFPFNYKELVEAEHPEIKLAYAAPEKIQEILSFLAQNGFGAKSKNLDIVQHLISPSDFIDGENPPWDEDEFESGAWRAKLDPDELAKSKELRGYMVPTPKDGIRVFEGPNGIYGWPPSKALAKRMKMEPNCIYDPVAVVVLEGYKKYRDMMSFFVSDSFIFEPLCVSYDDEGFYTSFSVQGDFSMYETHELMDYLTEFYFPLRIMPIKSWIYREENADFSSAVVNFRWTTEIGDLWATYSKLKGSGAQKASMPFLIKSNGSLELLQARVVGRCPFCGEETVIWANEAKVQDILQFNSTKGEVSTPNLSLNERESLITGLHPWCSGI